VLVVVIETDFTQSDDAGRFQQGSELDFKVVSGRDRTVRMDAGRR
jgi:hypothetical protein